MGGGPPVVGGRGGGGRTEKGSRLKWQLGGGGEGNGAARGGEGDGEERDSPWAWCWSGRRERQPHSACTCTRGRLRGGGSSATGRTVGKACETDLGASCKRRSIRPATRAAGRRRPYHLLRPLSVAGQVLAILKVPPPLPSTHPCHPSPGHPSILPPGSPSTRPLCSGS